MAKERRHHAIKMLGAIFKAEASALAPKLKAVQDIASILMLRGGKVGVVAIDAGSYGREDQGAPPAHPLRHPKRYCTNTAIHGEADETIARWKQAARWLTEQSTAATLGEGSKVELWSC